jgi:hypothetical protein
LAGIIQASGLVTYVSDEKRCPLCRKQHAALEETRATEAEGRSLVAEIRRAELIFLRRKGNGGTEIVYFQKMVGIVHCKHQHKYADHSGVTYREFVTIAREKGYHTRPGVSGSIVDKEKAAKAATVRERYSRAIPANLRAAFTRHWEWAAVLAERPKNLSDPSTEMAYPPGQCAGPKTILLALDSGARPAAMTEKWCNVDGRSTGPNRHVRRLPGGGERIERRYFEHGQSVPPCATCGLILPLLICPGDEEDECTGHTPPGADTHPRPDRP